MKFQRLSLLTIVTALFLVFKNTSGNGNVGPPVQMFGYSFVRHCPEGWLRYKLEKFFKLFKDKKSWEDAKKMCENENSTLASVHSNEELGFLRSYFLNEFRTQKEYTETWIGGFKVYGYNFWTWLDNSPFDFVQWYPRNPVNETCIALTTHHEHLIEEYQYHKRSMYGMMLKSNQCHLPYHFMCQKYQTDVQRTEYSQ